MRPWRSNGRGCECRDRSAALPASGEDSGEGQGEGNHARASETPEGNQTDAEWRLWEALRAKRFAGYKFKRQQPIGAYIVDFVCFARRLVVEVDGSQHMDSPSDRKRDLWLTAEGFRVLRFLGHHGAARTGERGGGDPFRTGRQGRPLSLTLPRQGGGDRLPVLRRLGHNTLPYL